MVPILSPLPRSVSASIHFLRCLPIYKEQKPYTIRFTLPADSPVPRTNSQHEEVHDIRIADIRDHESDFSLSTQGFCVVKHESGMAYEDFANADKVDEVYLPGVARKLRELLDARHVQVYEHIIRRRDPEYPVSSGKQYEFDQPTNSAHIASEFSLPAGRSMLADVTEEHVTQLVEAITCGLPEATAKCMTKHQVQCINVWKPLRGPLNDWPLCVCDATSVDAEADLVPSDVVFAQNVVENIQVHHNPSQKWYYLSKQSPDELWVFQQSIGRSAANVTNGTPHCAFFDRSATPNGILRESIECRALVYFGDCEDIHDE